MARWAPLRDELASVEDRTTLAWTDLDRLVGGLPPSAYEYSAFWKGDRSAWSGFSTTDVRVGRSVTFVRRTGSAPHTNRKPHTGGTPQAPTPPLPEADVVLVGCVKTKLDRPAPARELYVSALFRRQRAYAEAVGVRWFVLSAQHGLVDPDTVLEPYDLRLSQTPSAYRAEWGRRVVAQLEAATGSITGKVVEIHAGAAYVSAVRERLQARGADVVEPLAGLPLGARLAWYAEAEHPAQPVEVSRVVGLLTDPAHALSPAALLASGGTHLRHPGLYSWWVDDDGASNLSTGLGQPLSPGLIYAGQAGATRSRSGRRSGNTLWGRISGMHLGGKSRFSTFRLSLGSVLASTSGADEIDETALTRWMHAHLRVIAVPIDHADRLDDLESAVLAALDPPLNLSKMPPSTARARLTVLRRRYGRRANSARPGPVAAEN